MSKNGPNKYSNPPLGVVLESFWDCFGVVLDLFWGRVGIVLGYVLESFWGRFGIVLGSFWDRFGFVSGSFWDRFGLVLGSFRDRFGVVSVSILYLKKKRFNPVTAITKIIRKCFFLQCNFPGATVYRLGRKWGRR